MATKVLVIQTAFIGDAILASSLVETIHREQPEAAIHLLVRKGNEVLYQNHPYIKQLWVWDKKKKYASLLKLLRAMKKVRFDWVFCVQRFGTMGLFTTLLPARQKVGFNKNPWRLFFTHRLAHTIGDGKHEIERNTSLLKPWLGPVKPAQPKLHFTATQLGNTAALREQQYVCLFPGSVWKTKQLPKAQWIEILRNNPTTTFYLMGAPGDAPLCQEIVEESGHKTAQNLCGKLNLMESATVVRDAQNNLVNDSAPLHLASATGAPTTAFFCSTVPNFGFGPLSETQQVIEVQENLSCRPCGLHGKKSCPLGHFHCGNKIDVSHLTFS